MPRAGSERSKRCQCSPQCPSPGEPAIGLQWTRGSACGRIPRVHLFRTSGDYFVYRKAGNRFNLSIPAQRVLDEGTLRQIIKTMGLSVDEFLKLASK